MSAVTQAQTLGRSRPILWPIVAAALVAGFGILCWNQIARTLDNPTDIELSYGGGARPKLPQPRGGTAVAHDVQIHTVAMSLSHISTQLQWMIALAIVLQFVLIIAVLLTIGVIWVRTSAGRPFARSVTTSLVTLAALVAIVGTASEQLQTFIGNREAFEVVGNNNVDGYYSMFPGFEFSGFSLLVALGIGLLASAFAIGARLTRDTDGLV